MLNTLTFCLRIIILSFSVFDFGPLIIALVREGVVVSLWTDLVRIGVVVFLATVVLVRVVSPRLVVAELEKVGLVTASVSLGVVIELWYTRGENALSISFH